MPFCRAKFQRGGTAAVDQDVHSHKSPGGYTVSSFIITAVPTTSGGRKLVIIRIPQYLINTRVCSSLKRMLLLATSGVLLLSCM